MFFFHWLSVVAVAEDATSVHLAYCREDWSIADADVGMHNNCAAECWECRILCACACVCVCPSLLLARARWLRRFGDFNDNCCLGFSKTWWCRRIDGEESAVDILLDLSACSSGRFSSISIACCSVCRTRCKWSRILSLTGLQHQRADHDVRLRVRRLGASLSLDSLQFCLILVAIVISLRILACSSASSSGSASEQYPKSWLLLSLQVIVVVSAVARCRTMRRVRLQRQLHPEQESQRQQQSHLHKGLEKDQIQALPVITFGTEKFPVEGYGSINDCVVCLSDYQKGDQLRLLPLCKHYFHVACIDTWLSTHISCPVCRHSVLQQQQSPADDHHTTADPTSEADHQSSAAVEDSQDTGRRISRSSARFGTRNVMMIFGRARVASAIITSHQQHMDIDVEPGRSLDVAAGGAASTSDQSARWSFSAMFSKLASAIQSLWTVNRIRTTTRGYLRAPQRRSPFVPLISSVCGVLKGTYFHQHRAGHREHWKRKTMKTYVPHVFFFFLFWTYPKA